MTFQFVVLTFELSQSSEYSVADMLGSSQGKDDMIMKSKLEMQRLIDHYQRKLNETNLACASILLKYIFKKGSILVFMV